MLELDEITSAEAPRDAGLSQLQGQIKNVMIPLLIKIFQLRLEVQQTTSPPSRLESSKPKIALEDLINQLNRLNEDLKLLQIWNQSCQKQIAKVLLEAESSGTQAFNNLIRPDCAIHPGVQKSFQGALLAKNREKLSLSRPFSPWKKQLKRLSFFYRNLFYVLKRNR